MRVQVSSISEIALSYEMVMSNPSGYPASASSIFAFSRSSSYTQNLSVAFG